MYSFFQGYSIPIDEDLLYNPRNCVVSSGLGFRKGVFFGLSSEEPWKIEVATYPHPYPYCGNPCVFTRLLLRAITPQTRVTLHCLANHCLTGCPQNWGTSNRKYRCRCRCCCRFFLTIRKVVVCSVSRPCMGICCSSGCSRPFFLISEVESSSKYCNETPHRN